MSQLTTNLGLVKPEKTDPADITATNNNWDKLDGMFKLEGDTPVIPIEKGGTGSFTAFQALKNLGAAPSTYINGVFTADTIDEFTQQTLLLINDLPSGSTGRYFISKGSPDNFFPEGTYLVEIDKWDSQNTTVCAKNVDNGTELTIKRVQINGVWSNWKQLSVAPAYAYGTEELTPGVSELATGTLYFVYE
jgi:hypothetical protein